MFKSALDLRANSNKGNNTTLIKIPKEQLSEKYWRVFINGNEKKINRIDGNKILPSLAPFEFNPIQSAFHLFYKGENTIVSTPTGTGKTITFYLALHYKGIKKTIYISPTRALANQTYKELKEKTSLKIYLKTGENDVKIEDYDVIVTTAESFVAAARNRNKWVKEAKLLVFDEIHVITNDLRSIAYEEAVIHAKSMNKKLLLLSATIPGIESLADWLDVSLIIMSDWRPVPLKRRFYKITLPTQSNISKFLDELKEEILDNILKDNSKAIIVVPSKKIGWLLLEELEKRGYRALNETVPYTRHEKGEIRVAFHNADVPKEERELIEELFKDKNSSLNILIATQTLAMGFNSPADDVILVVRNFRSSLFPNILDLLQFEGRAGRLGYTKRSYGVAHYIVGKGEKTEKLLKEELNYGLDKEFETVLSKSYNTIESLFKKKGDLSYYSTNIDKEVLIDLIKKFENINEAFDEEFDNEKIWEINKAINNISLIILGIFDIDPFLIKETYYFNKNKNKSFKIKNFTLINSAILEILKEKNLIISNKLSKKGKLLSSFYIDPFSYFEFEKEFKKFKEDLLDSNFEKIILWNILPLLLNQKFTLPDFYPQYYLEDLPEEVFYVNEEIIPLLLYSKSYFAEYFDIEVKERDGEIYYEFLRLKPPVWVANLSNDIPRIINFIKELKYKKLLNLDVDNKELENLAISFITGIDFRFSKLADIKNIGYVRAWLLIKAFESLRIKSWEELEENFEYIDKKVLLKEMERKLENIYVKKAKLLVKEKFNHSIITDKLLDAIKRRVKSDIKELNRALDLLSKHLNKDKERKERK